MEIIINKPITGDGKNFKVYFTQSNQPFYTEIPLKAISKQLKGKGFYVDEAVETFITYHRKEITIISLN